MTISVSVTEEKYLPYVCIRLMLCISWMMLKTCSFGSCVGHSNSSICLVLSSSTLCSGFKQLVLVCLYWCAWHNACKRKNNFGDCFTCFFLHKRIVCRQGNYIKSLPCFTFSFNSVLSCFLPGEGIGVDCSCNILCSGVFIHFWAICLIISVGPS